MNHLEKPNLVFRLMFNKDFIRINKSFIEEPKTIFRFMFN